MADDDDLRERRSLRVASRAVRRGRKLKPSVLPPVPLDTPAPVEPGALEDLEDWDEPPHSRLDWSEVDEPPRPSLFPSEMDLPIATDLEPLRGSPFEEGEPPSDGIRIGVHDSTFPIAPTQALRSSPSIRIHESLMPDDVEEEVPPPPSLRFSRPPAPSMDLAARRSTRPPTPMPPRDEGGRPTRSSLPTSTPPSSDDFDGPPTRRGSERPDDEASGPRRLRRTSSIGVWTAIGLMVVVAGWMFSRASDRAGSSSAASPSFSVLVAPDSEVVRDAKATMASVDSAVASAEDERPDEASSAPAASPDDSPAAQANAALAATQIDARDLADLRSWFVKLMNRGMYKEAENFAREMIGKWPTHATGYLCLGAALQDQGRPKAAIGVYTDCVARAKTGDASECLHLGGTLKGRKR